MFYPYIVNLVDTKQTTSANASALVGVGATPVPLYVDHAGPGMLFYGMEVVSAADASGGGSKMVFQYTSRDGNPMTSSGSAINHSTVSNTATGCFPINLASNSTLGYWISCTAAVSGAAMPNIRYWITYLGGGKVGPAASSTGFGMIAG